MNSHTAREAKLYPVGPEGTLSCPQRHPRLGLHDDQKGVGVQKIVEFGFLGWGKIAFLGLIGKRFVPSMILGGEVHFKYMLREFW